MERRTLGDLGIVLPFILALSLAPATLSGCNGTTQAQPAVSATSAGPIMTTATPAQTSLMAAAIATATYATATPAQDSQPTRSPSPSPTATETPTPSPTATPMPTATPIPPKPTAAPLGSLAPLIVRGDTRQPSVSLTFDSGSVVGSTAGLLDVLRDNGVRTTFFITGAFAETNPALLTRIVADGHTIANHSFSHPDLTTVSDDVIVSELSRTEATIKRIAGVTTKPYFRPPFGAYNDRLRRVLAREGYKAIYWTLDSADWRDETTAETVRQRVVNNAGPGYIVVNHSSPEKTAKAMPAIIRQVREKGLKIVNLSELLGD